MFNSRAKNWSVASILALLLSVGLPQNQFQNAQATQNQAPTQTASIDVVLKNPSESPMPSGFIDIYPLTGGYEGGGKSASADSLGKASFTASPGLYEIALYPTGEPDATSVSIAITFFTLTVTNSAQVEIRDRAGNLVSPDQNNRFHLVAKSGNIFGKLVDSFDNPLPQDWDSEIWANANLEKWNGDWWEYVGQSWVFYDGKFALYAPSTGDYRVRLQLTGFSDFTSTVTAPFSFSNQVVNLGNIRAAVPNLGGIVTDPNGNPIQHANVVPVSTTGEQLWQYSGFTNSRGEWKINIPSDGTYMLMAEQPWQSSFVSSAKFGPITISNSVVQTPATSPNAITLALRNPNLEITVLAGLAPAADLWTNLFRVNDQNWDYLSGSQTDSFGKARFFVEDPTATYSFRAEVGDSPSLRALYKNTEKQFIPSNLSLSSGVYRLSLPLEVPNFQALIRTPSGNPVSYGWVELFDAATEQWLLGENSGRNGLVSLTIPTPQSGVKEYRLRANPSYQSSEPTSANRYKLFIDSNGAITVRTMGDSNVGTTTVDGRSGVHVLDLLRPNVVGTVFDPNGQTVRDTGIVPLIRDVFSEYLWQSMAHSNQNGRFAMNLPVGNYLLQAQAPWNRSGLSPSQKCSFDIAVVGGIETMVATNLANACSISADGVSMSLREPNLTFTLSDKLGNPVPYANVGVGFRNWFTWGNSNSQGKVALFIDPEEIFSMNSELVSASDSISLSFWVDPPWGTSNLVRWDCVAGDDKPLCKDIGPVTNSPFATTTILENVEFEEPNTKIRVAYTESGTIVGPGAWVSLFKQDPNCTGCRIWLGGSVTDLDGYAAFNLADTNSATAISYSVEVNPPWQDRDKYTSKTHFVADYSGLSSGTFSLGAPNLALKIYEQDGSSAKWGWVGVERLDANGVYFDWIGGYGIDNQGFVNMTLPDATTMSITVYPGPGSKAVPQKCTLYFESVNSLTPLTCSGTVLLAGSPLPSNSQISYSVNAIVVNLTNGNVSGEVKFGSQKLSGALVVASKSGEVKQTTTDSRGKYSLQLTDGTWEIQIFYALKPEDDPATPVYDSFQVTITESRSDTLVQNFSLGQ